MKSDMSPKMVKAADALPISVADARAHLRVKFSEDDDLIEAYIQAAVGVLDGWSGRLGRCLINQQWQQSFRGWPPDRIFHLPFPDVSSVIVNYLPENGQNQEVSSDCYELLEGAAGSFVELNGSFSRPKLKPEAVAPVTLTFTAGYGVSGDKVPAAIRHALLMIVGHFYENREDVVVGTIATSLPQSSQILIAPFRRTIL